MKSSNDISSLSLSIKVTFHALCSLGIGKIDFHTVLFFDPVEKYYVIEKRKDFEVEVCVGLVVKRRERNLDAVLVRF